VSLVAAVGREAKALFGGDRGRSLAVIAGSWGLLLGVRMIYPILLPYFRASFDLSLTVAGLLVTILWLGSAVGQLPGGILADRYSERSIMIAGTLVVALSIGAVVVAPTALWLFAATALVGLGQSLYPIARITILADIYPDRIGSALGVTMATGDLAQTVLPPLAGVVAAAVAWQAGLGFLIPCLLLAAVALWWQIPRGTDDERIEGGFSVETVRGVVQELRGTNTRVIIFVLFLYILVWQAFTGLYPTYLVEEKGLTSSTASVLFSLFFAIGIVVKPLAGAAYDRVGIRGALVMVLVAPVVGFGSLPFVHGVPALVAVTACISTMLGSGAITQSFLSDAFAGETRGTGLGVVRTATATVGAAGPVLLGAVADRGYFDEGYLVLGGLMLVVLVLVVAFTDA
jgi:MFS family permease